MPPKEKECPKATPEQCAAARGCVAKTVKAKGGKTNPGSGAYEWTTNEITLTMSKLIEQNPYYEVVGDPAGTRQNVKNALMYFVSQSMWSDEILGGYCTFIENDPQDDTVTFQMTSPFGGDALDKFVNVIKGLFETGDLAWSLWLACKDGAPSLENLCFTLELGLHQTTQKCLMLMHYTTPKTQQFSNFASTETIGRWYTNLAMNDMSQEMMWKCNLIIDLVPVRGPSTAGSSQMAYFADKFDDFAVAQIKLYLSSSPAGDAQSIPIVCFGSTDREFLWRVYRAQCLPQLTEEEKQQWEEHPDWGCPFKHLKVLRIHFQPDRPGQVTPVIIANHPSAYLNDVEKPYDDPGNQYGVPAVKIQEDLIVGGWVKRMTADTQYNPDTAKSEASGDWATIDPTVYARMEEQNRCYWPNEMLHDPTSPYIVPVTSPYTFTTEAITLTMSKLVEQNPYYILDNDKTSDRTKKNVQNALIYFVSQSMWHDGILGGYCMFLPSTTDSVTLQLTSPFAGDALSKFCTRLRGMFASGDTAYALWVAASEGQDLTDLCFTLELGLHQSTQKSIMLMHYTTPRTQQFSNFASTETIGRYYTNLAMNNMSQADMWKCNLIIDIVPVRGPSTAGSTQMEYYGDKFDPFAKEQVELYVGASPVGQSQTIPLIAFGGTVKEFLWRAYFDQCYAQCNADEKKQWDDHPEWGCPFPYLRIIKLSFLTDRPTELTPVIFSRHPSAYLNDVNKSVNPPDPGNEYGVPREKMQMDLTVAGWLRRMVANNEMNVDTALSEAAADWAVFDPTIYDRQYMQNRCYNPNEMVLPTDAPNWIPPPAVDLE